MEILEGYRDAHRRRGDACSARTRQGAGREWRARIGIVLQSCAMPSRAHGARARSSSTPATTRSPRPVDETIELVGLEDEARTRERRGSRAASSAGSTSALALIGDPELVFLDEPTTGFDPSARHHAWEVIANLRDLGKTVFLTTHYMDEAQALADRVAVIAAGRIVAEGTPDDARRPRQRRRATSRSRRPHGVDVGALPAELAVRGRGAGRAPAPAKRASGAGAARARPAWALEHGCELDDLTVGRPTLEDVYLRLTETTERDL